MSSRLGSLCFQVKQGLVNPYCWIPFLLHLVRVGMAIWCGWEKKQGQVSAHFYPESDHPIYALLEENGLFSGSIDDGVLLRRIQSADGRTRAFVNDQTVSVALLRQVGQKLVEIHGQHEERAMIDPNAHRDLVDAFGSLEKERTAVGTAYSNWREAVGNLNKLKARVEKAAKEADYLRSSVEELETLSPPGRGRRRTGRPPTNHDGGGAHRNGYQRSL